MMKVLAVALLAATIVGMVNGHAVLKNPVAWNPSPSKTSPCGAGAAFTSAAGTITPGQNNTFTWQVVAGDGIGPVTFSYDRNAGTTFTALQTASVVPTVVGTYVLTIFFPSWFNCTGGSTGDLCTLQAKSSSAWYSCTTVNVASGASTSTGVSGSSSSSASTSSSSSSTGSGSSTCYTAPTLKFCTGISGVSIDYKNNMQLQPNSVAAWDLTVNTTYVQNLNSKLVFTHQFNDACFTDYKSWLCASSFPLCNTAGQGTCTSRLLIFKNACGVNATHEALFAETDNKLTTQDSMGSCPVNGATTAAASFVMIAITSLFALMFQQA